MWGMLLPFSTPFPSSHPALLGFIKENTPTQPPQNVKMNNDFTQKMLTSNICKTSVLICHAS